MEPAVKQEIIDPENYKAFETKNLLIKSEPLVQQEIYGNASNILPFETENLNMKSEIKTEPVIKQEIIEPETDEPFVIENHLNTYEMHFVPKEIEENASKNLPLKTVNFSMARKKNKNSRHGKHKRTLINLLKKSQYNKEYYRKKKMEKQLALQTDEATILKSEIKIESKEHEIIEPFQNPNKDQEKAFETENNLIKIEMKKEPKEKIIETKIIM